MLETDDSMSTDGNLIDNNADDQALFTGLDALVTYYRKNVIVDSVMLQRPVPNGNPLPLHLRVHGVESPLHRPWELSLAFYQHIFRAQNQHQTFKLICESIGMRSKEGFTGSP